MNETNKIEIDVFDSSTREGKPRFHLFIAVSPDDIDSACESVRKFLQIWPLEE